MTPATWIDAAIGDVTAPGQQGVLTGPFGATLGKNDFELSGTPVLTIGCITNSGITLDKAKFVSLSKGRELSAYALEHGDLLFSRMASVGKVGLVEKHLEGALFNYHIIRLRLDFDIVSPAFAVYFLRGSTLVRQYLDKVARGATRDGVNTSLLTALPITIPPPAEQQRIVAKIDALSAHSKRARADLDRVEVLAARAKQEILRAAFSGELTERWRSMNPQSSTTASDSRLDSLRRAVWAERLAETGRTKKYTPAEGFDWTPQIRLPAEWRWVSVDQIAPVSEYGTSAKTDSNGEIPILRMGNIQRGEIVESELKYLPLEHDEFPTLLLRPGDVLFNRTNSPELVGKSAVYRDRPRGASFASYLIRLRTAGYEPELLTLYINSLFGREWVGSVVTQQVGQANVNGTKLSRLGVPLMCGDEQREIVKRIRVAFAALDNAVSHARRVTTLLDRLDQSILAKAFRGELVPQDPNDEPASALLDRIRAERAKGNAPKPRGRGRA